MIMVRGRKPKTIALHLAEGTYRKDRHGPVAPTDAAPVAPKKMPTRPAALKGAAKTFWEKIVAELSAIGAIGQIDVPLIEHLCEMYALYQAALKEAKRFPLMQDARMALKTYADLFNRGLSECGLTPVARARLKIDTSDKPKGVAARQRGVS